jgi:glycosyl transferase family 25
MKIFVVHYKKLTERKTHILKQFQKHNMNNYEFVEIDRDELDNENLNLFENNYSNTQIAIHLSNMYAYKIIAEKYDNGLIFEDDVILDDNFLEKFENYCKQLPDDFDMFFIGTCLNIHIPTNELIKDKNVYKTNNGTRCTHAYFVSKKCAKKICHYLNNLKDKINIPIDHYLNKVIKDNNFQVYWAEPSIVSQGSETNLFKSSIKILDRGT